MFGETIYSYETVTSTQDIAKEKALADEPSGAVITAAFQTGGRGRRGRHWFAPSGANVCLTAIAPPVAFPDAWKIALVVGIAVAEGIRLVTTATPTLRFPNDIWCEGAKLAGILVETTPSPKAGFITPLIGIGVNVNISEETFPEDLRAKSTSLLRVTRTEYAIEAIQNAILERMNAWWEAFEQSPLEEVVLPRWHALADPNARRTFVIHDQPVSCRIVQIAADGIVTLETEAGEIHRIAASQVIFGDDE
jgi:BirA family biotin operon repressor/biotin-[acetyl-CoA-carboxylase] ligase